MFWSPVTTVSQTFNFFFFFFLQLLIYTLQRIFLLWYGSDQVKNHGLDSKNIPMILYTAKVFP